MKDPQHNAHEMAYRARWGLEISQERRLRRRMFEGFKEVWRNAPIEETGLKPLRDVWHAQQRGTGTITEEDFWKALARSIHEGFFDDNRELFSVTDKLNRILSQRLRETLRWDDEAWPLLLTLLRDTWATIGTMSEWADSQGFVVPPNWQKALDNEHRKHDVIRANTGKRNRTKASVLQAFRENPQEVTEQVGLYIKRISIHLKSKNVQAGERLVRDYHAEQKRSGRNGRT